MIQNNEILEFGNELARTGQLPGSEHKTHWWRRAKPIVVEQPLPPPFPNDERFGILAENIEDLRCTVERQGVYQQVTDDRFTIIDAKLKELLERVKEQPTKEEPVAITTTEDVTSYLEQLGIARRSVHAVASLEQQYVVLPKGMVQDFLATMERVGVNVRWIHVVPPEA